MYTHDCLIISEQNNFCKADTGMESDNSLMDELIPVKTVTAVAPTKTYLTTASVPLINVLC